MTTIPPTEYRVFNVPGHGRVRAPAKMSIAELQAALADATETDDTTNN